MCVLWCIWICQKRLKAIIKKPGVPDAMDSPANAFYFIVMEINASRIILSIRYRMRKNACRRRKNWMKSLPTVNYFLVGDTIFLGILERPSRKHLAVLVMYVRSLLLTWKMQPFFHKKFSQPYGVQKNVLAQGIFVMFCGVL